MTIENEAFEKWLEQEMPSGTVIGNPKWWAKRIAQKAIAYMQEVEASSTSEPVAYTDGKDDFMSLQTYKDYERLGFFNNCTIPLYTTPQSDKTSLSGVTTRQPLKRLSKERVQELCADKWVSGVINRDELSELIIDAMQELNK